MNDLVGYFKALKGKLKLTKKFTFETVSDVSQLEEVIVNSSKTSLWFVVEDCNDGKIFKGSGDIWYDQRPTTVFLLQKLTGRHPDTKGRNEAVAKMRCIYHQLLAKIEQDIREERVEGLQYLEMGDIPYFEVPSSFAGGHAGIYFVLTPYIPMNIELTSNEWSD